ncbi:sulfate ABC transporter substrate-binding protein [Paenibacillus sp. ACRRX]|uniref:sulfate ABC transporter substrate-binding protein n=1 Tax=Paenibacillus sp. ACRRX TaxID=2918206 RepID=UPI001EF45968|nr:sulfate ABC transporter substrate-binding protein [Paenibacillus sp. ACRRX]MCG7409990.1 sulfate ABC transporter substrate-binding protein [Paenibacillus sp. ACRRX]
MIRPYAQKPRFTSVLVLLLTFTAISLTGCVQQEASPRESLLTNESKENSSVTLVIGAYSVAKDALQLIIPAFQQAWKQQTGQTVQVQQSYEASGTQARSIAGGLEADVALFAMSGDVDKLVKAKLVSPQWQEQDPYGGMVTNSIVVIGTRAHNPHQIKDWQDLTREDVDVLYPNPKTSGGAQWDINAIYGSGLQLAKEQGEEAPTYAKKLLADIHSRVISMDKSGRASMAAFEYGVGDAIVTYENELIARQKQGVNYEIVVPKHTIRIDNPIVVVDRYADKHGTREAAEAFVAFARSEKAQQIWVEAGFRAVNEQVAKVHAAQIVNPEGLFTIEDMGGWEHVRETLYSKRGIWYQVLAGF